MSDEVAAAAGDVVCVDGSAAFGRVGLGVCGVVGGGSVVHSVARVVDVDPSHAAFVAEALALLEALTLSSSSSATLLTVRCDCRPLLDVLGRRDGSSAVLTTVRALQPTLRLVDTALVARAARGAQTTLTWLPRHKNQEANALARAALGLADKLPRWLRARR